MVFPPEIYAEIIPHIKDNKSLLALLLTSRLLNQETERVLYREPVYSQHHQHKILTRLLVCHRVAQHVHSLEIWVEVDLLKKIRHVLNALINLKTLTLWRPPHVPQELHLSSLISDVSFQISKFITNSPMDGHLKSFLQSQRQIMVLDVRGIVESAAGPDLVLSRTDLPSLAAVHYAVYGSRIETIFPDFFITNLSLKVNIDITMPLPAVRALRTANFQRLKSVLTIFPNLLYLETGPSYQNIERGHRCLQKLKLWSSAPIRPDHATAVLLRLYTIHQNLKCVEACYISEELRKVTVHRLQERLNLETLVAEPVFEMCVENYWYHRLEWVTWKG